MIDTVVVTFKESMFTILDPDRFTPSARGFYSPVNGYQLGGRSNMSCVQNPSSTELKSGIYKPRLTLSKRFTKNRVFEMTLKVEFSIPKLIFGNNFDELEDSDFDRVIKMLRQRLQEMGVRVFELNLINAPISGIHFGKNIPLTDYTTPYGYLDLIRKSNISMRLDLNQTDFRNEGHSLKFRANSFEIAFYDKLKDLKKAEVSEKRAEEKDNQIQLDLFKDYQIPHPFEVLRMEIRLNRKQKLIQILKKIGIKEEPTLKSLFHREISQSVLMFYLNEIEIGYPKITYFKHQPKDFILDFIMHNPKAGYKKTLQMLGLRILVENSGIREVREMMKQFGNANWYRLNKEIKEFNYPGELTDFKVIRDCLINFEPLKMEPKKGVWEA